MANKKIKFVLEAVNKTKAQFDKVTRQLNTLKNAGAGVAKAMIGVTVAIAATAVAFGAVVKKSFEFIDAIGKTATRTGLATSTIQAFSLAALVLSTAVSLNCIFLFAIPLLLFYYFKVCYPTLIFLDANFLQLF